VRPTRWEWIRFALAILLLLLAGFAAFIGGCIRRYPAPVEPPEATMPYSAIATWRRVALPAGEGEALPEAALRLAVGPGVDDVFADDALVAGRAAGRTADGWDASLELLERTGGPVVLLVDRRLAGSEVCERLAPLGDRLRVATGTSGHAADGPGLREPAEGLSRDPLSVGSLEALCATVAWWSSPRRGANVQNQTVEPELWQAAGQAGIEWVRLVPDSWASEHRDFLIGDADAFEALVPEDLATLRRVLDDADAAGVRVVLAMFSLPGARWSQLNDDREDYRLWNEQGFRDAALEFWRQLAAELAGHPAIVAWNPLNEPHPDREHTDDSGYAAWQASVAGTLADVNRFNREVVAAIRDVDPDTPILLDGGNYASVAGLLEMEPLDDPAVLYAFHYYEPWEYVTFRVNDGRFAYPDRMPEGWSPDVRREALAGVAAWGAEHGIPASRIVAAEFGVDRRVEGAAGWLDDLLTDLDGHGWHQAFYAYRSDGWGGLDYELGTAPLPAGYHAAVEAGVDEETLKERGPNPLWEVLARRLRGGAR